MYLFASRFFFPLFASYAVLSVFFFGGKFPEPMAQGSFEDDRMICFCWDRRVLIAHIVASEMFLSSTVVA